MNNDKKNNVNVITNPIKKLKYSKDRIMEARDIRARWYNHEKTERVPYVFTVGHPVVNAWFLANPYNFRDMCSDGKKAVEAHLLCFQHQFDTFPDCDFLPYMNFYYLGEGILASMYGAKQLVDDLNPPFTEGRFFKDIYETEKIDNDFEVESTEWGAILKNHIELFLDVTDGEIPVGMPDYQSTYGTATKLMPNEDLMMAMYDEPELVHKFFNNITSGIIKLIETLEKWVGKDNLAYNVQNPIPGKCGLTIWDDYISVVTPKLHTEFCAPCTIRLYERFGYGHLHTCGPYFPGYIDACLACLPRSMDISIMRNKEKSKEDIYKLLSITESKNIRLFGDLTSYESCIFEGEGVPPDEEMIKRFIAGGHMPSSGGTVEDGEKFKQMILNLPKGYFI